MHMLLFLFFSGAFCVSYSVMSNSFDPMDYTAPDSSVHGILQPRILEWVAIPFSRGSSGTRDWTLVSCITGRFFTIWAPGNCHFESSILWIHFTASLIEGFITLVTGVDWSRNQEILILVLSMWPWASRISSPSVFLKLSQGIFSVCGWRVYYNISESPGALGFVSVVGGTCGPSECMVFAFLYWATLLPFGCCIPGRLKTSLYPRCHLMTHLLPSQRPPLPSCMDRSFLPWAAR